MLPGFDWTGIMKTLETNDWMVMNHIIYQLYTTEDPAKMREGLLEQLKLVLDFDSADFYLAAAEGGRKLVNPIAYHCDAGRLALYGKPDYCSEIMFGGKCLACRETDLITNERRQEEPYYKEVYVPNHWHYSMHWVLSREREFRGVITFYRTLGKEDFRSDDLFLLDMLKDHIAYRLYRDRREQKGMPEKLTVSQAAETYGLTKRERTILRQLMYGQDNAQICEELSISVNTLKKHILNIYRKLGIKNRVQMFKMIKEKE